MMLTPQAQELSSVQHEVHLEDRYRLKAAISQKTLRLWDTSRGSESRDNNGPRAFGGFYDNLHRTDGAPFPPFPSSHCSLAAFRQSAMHGLSDFHDVHEAALQGTNKSNQQTISIYFPTPFTVPDEPSTSIRQHFNGLSRGPAC